MDPISHQPHFKQLDSFVPDRLIGGDNVDQVTRSFSLQVDPAIYQRGTVLELSGTPGVYRRVTVDANAAFVLLEAVDATAAIAKGVAGVRGSYNANALILGVGATLAGVRVALEAKGNFVSDGFAY